jgi:hypothetical protein
MAAAAIPVPFSKITIPLITYSEGVHSIHVEPSPNKLPDESIPRKQRKEAEKEQFHL